MGTIEEYRPLITDGGTRFQTNYCDERPVQAIARALSAVENSPAEDLPLFYQYADPDAMNQLMETARDSNQDITVEIAIEDYNVIVDSDGTISISDPGGCSEDSE